MNLKKTTVIALAVIGYMGAAGHAYADDLKVYEPRVNKGEKAVEANLNYSFDHRHEQDNYFSQVYAAEYGVTNWWKTEIGGEVEKENDESNTLTNLKWENVIAPWAPGENFIDTGLYLELEKATTSGEPNNIEAKLLLGKDIGQVSTTANLIVGREFGPNSDTDLVGGAALKSLYRLDKKFQPGVEYYADVGKLSSMGSFDEQEHLVGPVAEGKIGPVRYDTGVLFGISDAAADTTLKLNLEYEF